MSNDQILMTNFALKGHRVYSLRSEDRHISFKRQRMVPCSVTMVQVLDEVDYYDVNRVFKLQFTWRAM
eukprot:6211727-Pleurochrysis_carterae.AAC.1